MWRQVHVGSKACASRVLGTTRVTRCRAAEGARGKELGPQAKNSTGKSGRFALTKGVEADSTLANPWRAADSRVVRPGRCLIVSLVCLGSIACRQATPDPAIRTVQVFDLAVAFDRAQTFVE